MSKVVCIGEVLWDSLPHGKFLGGAPLNVAINLNHLGVDSSIISAVGEDELGDQTLSEIKERGLDTNHIQKNKFETGLVEVELSEKGIPSYVIHEQRAWDFISATESARAMVTAAEFVVFGSLAFRNKESATSIKAMLKGAKGERILDVNFRKPFYSKILVEELLGYTDILKVNDEEIEEMAEWFGLSSDYQQAIPKLCYMYGIDRAIITLGEAGSSIYYEGEFVHLPRFNVEVKDTVGAGDAFLSGAIYSMIQQKSSKETLRFANAMGAFVAGSDGATPSLNYQTVYKAFLG
jgi:fructokinase